MGLLCGRAGPREAVLVVTHSGFVRFGFVTVMRFRNGSRRIRGSVGYHKVILFVTFVDWAKKNQTDMLVEIVN